MQYISHLYVKKGMDKGWEEESAQIRVMLDPAVGTASRPVLVFSCVSRETPDRHRIHCVTVAEQLQLSSLVNPWMVRHQNQHVRSSSWAHHILMRLGETFLFIFQHAGYISGIFHLLHAYVHLEMFSSWEQRSFSSFWILLPIYSP